MKESNLSCRIKVTLIIKKFLAFFNAWEIYSRFFLKPCRTSRQQVKGDFTCLVHWILA